MFFQFVLCIIAGLLAIWAIYREAILAATRRKLALQVRKCDAAKKRLETANFQIDEQRGAMQHQVSINQRQCVQNLDLAAELGNEQASVGEYQRLNHAMAVRLLEAETDRVRLNRELTRIHALFYENQNKTAPVAALSLN